MEEETDAPSTSLFLLVSKTSVLEVNPGNPFVPIVSHRASGSYWPTGGFTSRLFPSLSRVNSASAMCLWSKLLLRARSVRLVRLNINAGEFFLVD